MSNTSVADYPLIRALLRRRSRRFAPGMSLTPPLEFTSRQAPQPLSEQEEALLAFAACGITGYALAELPYQPEPESSGGQIMTNFVGRTAPSGDAMHDCTIFLINDNGTYLLRRPQDFPRAQIPELIDLAHRGEFVDLYRRSRVSLTSTRVDVPRIVPFLPPFNKWSANVPGTSYFLPVGELTALYINVLLAMFEREFQFFLVDDMNGFQPAGIERFAVSRGGELDDDPAHGRVISVSFLDTWICEFVAIEQGAILQNLGLMAAAMDVGGFVNFAAHPFIWPQVLGFKMQQVRSPMGFDIPTPVGLEHEGKVLIKPFCPPSYPSMESAVRAFIDYKFAPGTGTFRDGGEFTAWRDAKTVQKAIPRYSDNAIAATIAACDYLYQRYGRIPPTTGPFRTVLAYQAHRLDREFYARYYRPEAVNL